MIKTSASGYWMSIAVDGRRVSGDLWQRDTLDAAVADRQKLIDHWTAVSIAVYGSVEAAVAADLAAAK